MNNSRQCYRMSSSGKFEIDRKLTGILIVKEKATLFLRLDMVLVQPLPVSPKYWSSMWDILCYGNRNSYSHIIKTIFHCVPWQRSMCITVVSKVAYFHEWNPKIHRNCIFPQIKIIWTHWSRHGVPLSRPPHPALRKYNHSVVDTKYESSFP